MAQVSSRCLHYLPAAILEEQGGPATWRLLTKLYNFAHSISTTISSLGQRTHPKLRELSSLFIVYNITISWLYPLPRENRIMVSWSTTFAKQSQLKVKVEQCIFIDLAENGEVSDRDKEIVSHLQAQCWKYPLLPYLPRCKAYPYFQSQCMLVQNY